MGLIYCVVSYGCDYIPGYMGNIGHKGITGDIIADHSKAFIVVPLIKADSELRSHASGSSHVTSPCFRWPIHTPATPPR